MKKFLKKAEGFTLVELIVVIAILGILAGIAIPAYSGYINKANAATDTQTVDAVLTAAQASLAEVNGSVSKVEIDLTSATDKVVATIGTSKYVLVGTGVGDGSDADDKIETAARADYEMFINGNALPTTSFKQTVGTGNAKGAATKAVWETGKEWVFSK